MTPRGTYLAEKTRFVLTYLCCPLWQLNDKLKHIDVIAFYKLLQLWTRLRRHARWSKENVMTSKCVTSWEIDSVFMKMNRDVISSWGVETSWKFRANNFVVTVFLPSYEECSIFCLRRKRLNETVPFTVVSSNGWAVRLSDGLLCST